MSKKNKQYEQIIEAFKKFAEEKLDTLPVEVRFRFITDLLCLTQEGKRDEAFNLLLAFLDGRYHPSLEEEREEDE